ncbi:hypothetical protein CBR_g70730 [Chara braunii]|uniref:BED-type domain-containing protein n=1 Tax=Chara braunii TaxID=69332 RepID=A0A388KA85_CHABU|nr:hypothetical protein CBR_g70730 [Chara braunii]|eukprot:GBG66853.1 hypothetical protein CBR_g70730 [Chara braunii]
MAKLRRASCVWKYVTLGQPVGTWDKFHGDRKLRCNLCKHLWQRNQSKATRHFCQLKKCRVAQFDVLVDIWNDTDYRFDDRHHASIRTYMEEHDIRDSRAVAGGRTGADPCTAGRDDVQDVLDEMEEREGVELPGEEVVMTSRGEDPDMRKGKRAMGETDWAATRLGKRVRQSKIDEVYTANKQSVFNDKFLQWIYDSGILFNAFRRQSWREVRKAADELPRGVWMRFPSFKEIGGDGVPEQRAKVASLLREVRESFSHSGATILSDGRKSRDSRPIVNFLAAGANGAPLYATICRDGSYPVGAETAAPGEMGASPDSRWRVLALCRVLDSCDGAHPSAAEADRGGMMMSIVYEWSRHLVQLLTKLDVVPADLLTPCVREVRMRLMHLLEPAHAAAHLLNPRRRSLRYYTSLHTTTEDAEVVQECDRFLLAQTGGEPTSRDYLVVRDQMRRFHARSGDWGDRLVSDAEAEGCHGDQGTHRCAAWWFAHVTAHPELRAIAIRVMHMWTSASPAERNWAAHERIQTAKRSNLGFAKLAQLVEITTNLKLASCRQQGGGYVLPWVMEGVDIEKRLPDEDEDGDPEPDVWGARPVGTFTDMEITRQIDVFRKDGTSRPREVSAVFGDRAATLLPFDHVPPPPSRGAGEGSAAAAEDGEDDWSNAEDVGGGTDRTTEQVYFTYGGGSDRHAPRIVHDRAEYRTDAREREETIEERDARLNHEEEARLQSMPRWEGREAYEAERPRKRELETIGAGPPSSIGCMPTFDTMQPPSGPSDVVGGGADTCGLDAGGGGQADVPCEGGPIGVVETVGADTGVESSDDGEECAAAEAIVDDIVIGICAAGTDGGTHGGEEGMVDEGSVPLLEEELVDEGSLRLPPIGGRGSGRGSSSSHRGGVLGGWSSCRRVTDSLRRDYDRGRGLFARGASGEGDPAAGASEAGRPSVHTAGRVLGLDRVETRRTERLKVYPARSAIDDKRQGLPYTSGEEDLHMPQGSRHHGSIRDLDTEIVVDQQRLADLIRERERRSETEAQAEEADTETEPIDTAMRRERHRRVASAAGSHVAPVGREGAPHGRGRIGQRGALAGRRSAARHSTHTRRGSRG